MTHNSDRGKLIDRVTVLFTVALMSGCGLCLNCSAIRTLKSHSGYLCVCVCVCVGGGATVHIPICDVITHKAWPYLSPFKNPYHICSKETLVTAWVFSSFHSFSSIHSFIHFMDLEFTESDSRMWNQWSCFRKDVRCGTAATEWYFFSWTFVWSKHVTYTLSMYGV